ncbi:hypothetical protein B5M09_012905 [Aphanomyces astaci]|uniref:subtilisin n=1 Tax=Aphanomyces astaci TaxID=112090 RepID=A0A425DPZ3_APHAT|nr:hypothetical protein B5M09_012905 [Aphanomyces astaci]
MSRWSRTGEENTVVPVIALAATAVTAATDKISVQVHRNLEIAKQSNIVVKFHCDEALATHRRRLNSGASRTETIESLVDSLKEHTTKSQESVKSLLANQIESTAVEVATTWIQCSMYINNAPTDLVYKFAALPEVKSIYEPVTMTLGETQSDDKPASAVNDDIAWGVKKIQAPALWANGIEGDGIVVANIDTGVRYTHESLESNWRREYGWFDPYNKTNKLPETRVATELPDDGYSLGSGSSLAAPHVSGAIALYLSAHKGASYDQVYRALTEHVDTDTLTPPNKTCGDIPNTQYPNNLFGHGRLNIFKAVAASIPDLTLPSQSKSTQALNPTNDLSTCGTLEDNTHYVGGDLASVNLATVESC